LNEALRTTPAVALAIADRMWIIGDLIDAAANVLIWTAPPAGY
jgi:hypothetical protein